MHLAELAVILWYRKSCKTLIWLWFSVSGAWVFRGTRMPVRTVFENLEAGMSVDEITEVFDVTEEVKAVLHFAAGVKRYTRRAGSKAN
jgi:uncharacterized protein (DUF433 family)